MLFQSAGQGWVFLWMVAAGALIGELAAGALAVRLPGRLILMSSMLLCALAAVVFIGGRKQAVAAIYNRTE